MTSMTPRLIDRPPHRAITLNQLLARLGQTFCQGLSLQGRQQEPIITEQCDRHGNRYWHIYDPRTNRKTYCMSEAEVSLWLDHIVYRA